MEELKQEQMQEQQSVEEKPTTNEEKATRTYTQEEVNEIKKNAIAEGMRKASKQQANQSNDELDKLNASLTEKDNLLAEKENQMNELNKELTAIKQVNKMNDLGIDKKYHEDIFALIKGKGLEATEENIVEIAEAHPEWKVDSDMGVGSIGVVNKENDAYMEAQLKEQEEINKKFEF